MRMKRLSMHGWDCEALLEALTREVNKRKQDTGLALWPKRHRSFFCLSYSYATTLVQSNS